MGFWKGTGTLLGIGLVAVVGVSAVQLATAPMRSATGVVERTLDPNNVIATYERFHDRWKGYEARLRQIAETERNINAETDPRERQRLRVDLGAQRQSCREIAAGYNADAAKTNRSIFQGREAPATLDMERCG